MADFSQILESIAHRGLSNQNVGEKDYYDGDGLLVCGVCHKNRQKFIEIPKPSETDADAKEIIKVACMCECEEKAEQEIKKKKEIAQRNERIKRIRLSSSMDTKFATATFENFEVNKSNEKNLKICKRYASEFGEMVKHNQGLLFWGDVGTGKSFAAACIANYLIEECVPVVMTSFVKILEMIREGKTESDIIRWIANFKLVIFDDLGTERNTDYAIEKVYDIVDSRYRSCLPMILTTNLTFKEMKEEADIRYRRIYDRIFECCYPMQFTGPSWRRKTANRRFEDMEKLLND